MSGKTNYIFASDEYLLLNWLADHQTNTSTLPLVKFSQAELAREWGCSPTTINKRMKLLQKSGCLEPYNKKGNYRITETGYQVIARMNEIERIIGGTKNGH